MFINSLMLAGLAGAMLPLVLHFLSRARYRNVEWGGMMFLDSRKGRRSRGSRVKEISLLLLRMGIVGLLAMAMSRPVIGAGANGDQRTSMVIILDRSASMEVVENGPPRIETARRAAAAALGSLQPGDEAAVILLPESNQPPPVIQLTTDLQSLVVRINDARANPTVGRADFPGGLTAAARLLQSSHTTNHQIVLICDRQETNWRALDGNFAQTWRQSIAGPGGRMPQFTVIPVGGTEAGNVAIEDVQVINPPVVRDVPAEIEVKVRNFDTIPSAPVPLSVFSNFRDAYRTTLNLAPGESANVRCSLTFTFAGQQTLSAIIAPPGGLRFDDALETSIDVVDSIGVLVISGHGAEPSLSGIRTDADLIRLALAPLTIAGPSSTPDMAKVDVVSSDAWPVLDRLKYRAVILANVPTLSPAQTRQLEQYVYSGGGLLVAPGNLVRVADYSELLWKSGAGLLPAELEPPVPADGSRTTTLLGWEPSHPVFRFLKDRQDPLPRVTIGRYFPTEPLEPPAKVLGRYASGAPFLVEGAFGRGRVLLLTTSLDADWSTLPFTNSYLPMLQSAVRYLASWSQPNRNVFAGEPIVATITDMPNPTVSIETPQTNTPTTLEPLRVNDGYEIRYANTFRQGRYTLRIRSGRQTRSLQYSVRTSRDESDLSALTTEQSQDISRRFGCEWVDSDPPAIASAMTKFRKHRELWPFLMAGVVSLALLEVLLQRIWTLDGEKEPA